jgi:hypothetical protein
MSDYRITYDIDDVDERDMAEGKRQRHCRIGVVYEGKTNTVKPKTDCGRSFQRVGLQMGGEVTCPDCLAANSDGAA